MAAFRCFAPWFAVLAIGCSALGEDEREDQPGASPDPEPGSVADGIPLCDDTVESPADPRGAFAETEASVHELITCGSAQFTLMTGFVGQILASNEGFLAPEVREHLVPERPPFEHDGTGYWRMGVGTLPGSSFLVSFHRPDDVAGDHPIREDVFSLESYLTGARISGSPTPVQLLAEPGRRWDFQFSWDADGPLADLLGLEGSAERTLTLALSGYDLENLYRWKGNGVALPDLGPFTRLLELPARSHATVVDDRGLTSIRYEATGPARPMREMLDGGTIQFVFDSLEGVSSAVSLEGEARDLRFLSFGSLAGGIHYRFHGRGLDRLVADSDFGEGASYPRTTWSCAGE